MAQRLLLFATPIQFLRQIGVDLPGFKDSLISLRLQGTSALLAQRVPELAGNAKCRRWLLDRIA